METFSAFVAICGGNSPVTRSFEIFFFCAWINSWVNNREAGNLRRHRTHYDVIAMLVKLMVLHKQS